MTSQKEERFCHGANCTWFGSIHEVGKRSSLPCCPLCSGMLFELANENQWWTGVDSYESEGHPGYRAMWEWQRQQKKCFPLIGGISQLIQAYENRER